MKRFWILILFASQLCPSFAQDSLFKPAYTPGRKPDFHVTAGSSFAFTNGYGSALQTYITPSISYQAGKKWTLGGGISFINTNYFNTRPYFYGENGSTWSGNYTSAILFVNTRYQVNDRLSITGSGYEEIPITGKPYPYSSYFNTGSGRMQGIDLNIQYRLGKHAFLEAGFGYHEGRYPYYNDPFAPPGAGFMHPSPWGGYPGW